MITTTTAALPKNRTGLFAGDTLQEGKVTRTQPNPLTAHRQTGSAHSLLTSTEQSRASRTIIQAHHSDATTRGLRNGFRPSVIRRQKSRVNTTMTHYENQHRDLEDTLSKDSIPSSPGSAKLKAEIDQLNSRLKVYGDLNKLLRVQNNPDAPPASQSALSYSTCRVSSASTNRTASRLYQRFPPTFALNTGMTDVSAVASPSPFNEPEIKREGMDDHLTHAYQIPQRANVGSESLLTFNSPSSTTIRARSARSNREKRVSCPFYVMYFTNLAIQQRPESNDRISSALLTTDRSSSRRRTHTPLSHSALDDATLHSTSYYNNKRFAEKMNDFEAENSFLLKDILRTTSWNHLQV